MLTAANAASLTTAWCSGTDDGCGYCADDGASPCATTAQVAALTTGQAGVWLKVKSDREAVDQPIAGVDPRGRGHARPLQPKKRISISLLARIGYARSA